MDEFSARHISIPELVLQIDQAVGHLLPSWFMPSKSTDLLLFDGRAPGLLVAAHLLDGLLLAPVHADEAGVVASEHARHVGFRNRRLVLGRDIVDQRELRQERVWKLETGIVGGPADPISGTPQLPRPLPELIRLAPRHRAVEKAGVPPDAGMPRAGKQRHREPWKAR